MGVLEQTKTRKVFFGADNDALVRIIIINILVTAILFLIRSVYQLSDIDLTRFQNDIAAWFVLPAGAGKLLTRPWTLLTFMFSHIDIWSLIANMLWLWAFGFIIQSLLGSRRLAPLYIYGGLAGAIVYILCSNFLPSLAPHASAMTLSGANACVMAIAVAATVAAPGYRFFPMLNGGIPLWVLTVIYAAISFAGTSFNNPAAYGGELAGAATGFLFVKRLNKGYDPGSWMNRLYDWFFDLFNPDKAPDPDSARRRIFYDTHGKPPYKKKPNLNQERIDEILDKINRTGYHSLSHDEKDILHRAGEEDL
ncbi:rhomboid family intramembrane serine protease [Agriterribacter sp.]|uniref:rhomboid family intramembrane serine protease n=1 Tax=Agriterribacter sp. TaxID=2821509 RepID=UPI002C027985|nr:rhomboid family intramembrane serine protease [Agriterribacter sp.]HRO44549.1 rhomboid family intramembrane serine protease [Agriterribacter sp.]HRQ15986.1 rhomboid family intramembrane serine protease [Agriterribacter sp.]